MKIQVSVDKLVQIIVDDVSVTLQDLVRELVDDNIDVEFNTVNDASILWIKFSYGQRVKQESFLNITEYSNNLSAHDIKNTIFRIKAIADTVNTTLCLPPENITFEL